MPPTPSVTVTVLPVPGGVHPLHAADNRAGLQEKQVFSAGGREAEADSRSHVPLDLQERETDRQIQVDGYSWTRHTDV